MINTSFSDGFSWNNVDTRGHILIGVKLRTKRTCLDLSDA
jgi:hypothetical protein